MSIQCNVCNTNIPTFLYCPPGEHSLSSLGELINGHAEVYFCDECGHLQTQEIQNIDEYYDKQYKILIDSEDEDQLYKIEGNQKIYRYDFQAETALEKLQFTKNANILEFGAAKGATLKRLLKQREDLVGYAFDVSQMYIPFWDEFLHQDQQATYVTPKVWANSMDYVVSFYVLEHVSSLGEIMVNIREVLKENGTFYFIIPNTYENIADFVVADHVNHFSNQSLMKMMMNFGFSDISIDSFTHDSAFIVIGHKCTNMPTSSSPIDLKNLKKEAEDIANYWQNIADKIKFFEINTESKRVAIYGAGFYGSFIYSHLNTPSKVCYFIDQNVHLSGKQQFDIPIMSPTDLAADIDAIYIGLNPKYAKSIIANLPTITERNIPIMYL
jgi:SAM-dependent methyltransferase